MEAQKKNRRALRMVFTKIVNELDCYYSEAKPDKRQIGLCFDLLQQKYGLLCVVEDEIYQHLLESDTSEEELINEMEACDKYKRKFLETKFQFEDFMKVDDRLVIDGQQDIPQILTGTTESLLDGVVGRRKFKLPSIELRKYDGSIREWLPFWGQFKKIHEDNEIEAIDKIQYLIQSTIPGSRARHLVESYPCVNENYEKIIESLKSRFGSDEIQVEVYVRELLAIIINKTVSKEKMELSVLYDTLETQLRALETLGVTSEKCSAMLFPLIESCLPHDLLMVWQRSGCRDVGKASGADVSSSSKNSNRLNNLMNFIKAEVVNEQRIALASEGFGLLKVTTKEPKHKKPSSEVNPLPTASGLVNCAVGKCIFCGNNHSSENCFAAQKMNLDEKKEKLAGKKACFRCLKVGHQVVKCRARLKCIICDKAHTILMCPQIPVNKVKNRVEETVQNQQGNSVEPGLTNSSNCCVFLQTIIVTAKSDYATCKIRALIDTGSQRSYILKSRAELMRCETKGTEVILHGLFGGSTSEESHNRYEIMLEKGDYACRFEVLDQPMICNMVSPVIRGPWKNELKSLNIVVEDNNSSPIELLIGADVAGKLYTGNKKILKCGLVAMETLLGWTLMGRVPIKKGQSSSSLLSLSLLMAEIPATNLWNLDVLGITDPVEKKSRLDMEIAAKEFFEQTIKVNQEGRYEVRLPWVSCHPPLPDNYGIAEKRLNTTVRRLTADNLLDSYGNIFKEWANDGIIEKVVDDNMEDGHYLPHRPVLKDNSTTKIRPVFDASAHEGNKPSLNLCLEKGLNCIELIPSILLRFRRNRVAAVADIKKAFLQISVHEADRNFLKFLWIDDKRQLITYRHARVVFGVNSSPFMLSATIEHHLSECIKKCNNGNYSSETLMKLLNSFYVDNCVTSVTNEENLYKFIRESTAVMAEAKFELRGWESPLFSENITTPVLGLMWDLRKDVLTLNKDCLQKVIDIEGKTITKRLILSSGQKVFDPIGFCCPVVLQPKRLIQHAWKKSIGWDAQVDKEDEISFRNWLKELPYLKDIEIPRWLGISDEDAVSLHIFCDASAYAYSAVIFLRIEKNDTVLVQLVAAKARVAPLKQMTIPRLELLAAVIAARLYDSVKADLENVKECFFWSDSTTVLSWICRKEEWSVFVRNRIAEIHELTPSDSWAHIPGANNPADLASRGCSAKYLLESKWWEGPDWLYKSKQYWPQEIVKCDEETVNLERKKMLINSLLNADSAEWNLTYFSKYSKILRMIAWVERFIHNTRRPNMKRHGVLTTEEINSAEIVVLKVVQQETFKDLKDKRLHTLDPFLDEHGIIRLRTRVSQRDDSQNFRFPIVLPGKHHIVSRLVLSVHEQSCHVGTNGLLSILREKYWVLGGRRSIRSIISRCVVCLKQAAQPLEVPSIPLPKDRVSASVAFEVIGVDFAGPLYLSKTNDKAWICLFTCAVFRCVHLELTTSLSTPGFLQVLRRFIARRGRPKIIYSDNGTNFVGTENAFSRLDWDKIRDSTSVQRIIWRFNPPSAPWWGGFWERLIGVTKQLLRKVLGKASVNFEDLLTILCDCEAVVNSRPLTYLSNDPKELIALTPAMFMRDQSNDNIPDIDQLEQTSLNHHVKHLSKIREALRSRFRTEYLGQLKLHLRKETERQIQLDEVVLIGNDHSKRLDWPLGRVMELLPGKDGKVRLVRVKTSNGQLLRPVQRLYPLECINSSGVPEVLTDFQSRVSDPGVQVTRSGRISRMPIRLSYT